MVDAALEEVRDGLLAAVGVVGEAGARLDGEVVKHKERVRDCAAGACQWSGARGPRHPRPAQQRGISCEWRVGPTFLWRRGDDRVV
ncbi:hypothetical protein HYQ46_008541 [Verticillium longisporum]|nr:hypothetical protein HYQ46_008541 [Verticillium longisporum]